MQEKRGEERLGANEATLSEATEEEGKDRECGHEGTPGQLLWGEAAVSAEVPGTACGVLQRDNSRSH